MSRISIILLAQHPALLDSCLSNIQKHTKHPYELIIVNDGDQSAIHAIFDNFQEPYKQIIATPEISGVAKGFNLGATLATGDRLVFMRDHIKVTKHWLKGLNECLDRHPKAAMVGPVSHGISGNQNIDTPIPVLNKLKLADRKAKLTQYGTDTSTTRLLSFMLMIHKEAFLQLNGFDENFKLESYEDDDLCLRAVQAGYELYIARETAVQYINPPLLFSNDPLWYGRQLEANRQVGFNKWGGDLTTLLLNWPKPVSVSLCMIVKNEEETLDRCLSSIADLVDEINIIDTGSSDKTKEIASRYTNRIFDFNWVNDFSRARNFAFSQATQEYILWLDADDILLPEDRKKFKGLISSLPTSVDAVSMHYHLNRDEYGNVTSSLRRNRLVRRSMGFPWVGIVHEYLQVHGNILNSDIAITHDRVHTASTRNLHIYEAKLNEQVEFGVRDTYYYANELYDHGQWERAAEQYEKLLVFSDVWIEDKIGACGKAAECYMNLNKFEQAKLKALQSFAYALPRAENCCRLGKIYMSENLYQEAIWWYRLATELVMPTDSSALFLHACWTWLPYLQLCVCYDRLGEHVLAYNANEKAAEYLPQDQRIIANRAYLKNILEASSKGVKL